MNNKIIVQHLLALNLRMQEEMVEDMNFTQEHMEKIDTIVKAHVAHLEQDDKEFMEKDEYIDFNNYNYE